jgi:hypothetical protein
MRKLRIGGSIIGRGKPMYSMKTCPSATGNHTPVVQHVSIPFIASAVLVVIITTKLP